MSNHAIDQVQINKTAAIAEQQVAIDAIVNGEGDVAVVAAAGSGKSRVVTTAVLALLKDKGVKAEDILLVTFSRKGADVLRKRLEDGDVPERTAKRISTTFASISVARCREQGKPYEYSREWQSPSGKKEVKLCTSFRNDEDVIWKQALRGEVVDLSALPDPSMDEDDDTSSDPGKKDENMKAIETAGRMLYANGIDPESEEAEAWLVAHNYDPRVRTWYTRFHALLKQKGYWTFNQAMLDWSKNLGRPFKYVIVDEAQDNNRLQFQIVRGLAQGGRLIMVGDPRQTIHVWRGSAPELFYEFINAPTTTKVDMRYNWRSYSGIVELGNRIVAGRTWSPAPAQAIHVNDGECITLRAEDLVADVCKLTPLLTGKQQVAILSRNWKDLRDIEAKLIASKVSFEIKNRTWMFWHRDKLNPRGRPWRDHLEYVRRSLSSRTDDPVFQLSYLAENYQSYEEFEEATKSYFYTGDVRYRPHPKVYLGSAHSTKGEEYLAVMLKTSSEWPAPDDDECRLFYVACTRAEAALFIYGGNKDARDWVG